MARRVGFGTRKREEAQTPDPLSDMADEAEIAIEASGEIKKTSGPVARLVIVVFLLFWLALWSYGIVEAWDAMKSVLEAFDWDAFDIAMLAFFAVWLTGALVGWAFGVVLLVIMLFGKETERSPAQQAERLKRWRERRKGRRAYDGEDGA